MAAVRNPYSRSWLWIPGSSLYGFRAHRYAMPRNDELRASSTPTVVIARLDRAEAGFGKPAPQSRPHGAIPTAVIASAAKQSSFREATKKAGLLRRKRSSR